MKNNLIVICLMLLMGFSNTDLQKIDNDIGSSKSFASVSIERAGVTVVGKYIEKFGNNYREIVIWSLKMDNPNSIDVTEDTLLDYSELQNGNVKSLRIYPDGTSKVRRLEKDKGFLMKKIDKYAWENTWRGLAINLDYIRIDSTKKQRIQGVVWERYTGKYDLSGTKNLMNIEAQNGEFVVWANNKEYVEIYGKNLDKPIFVRAICININKRIELDTSRKQLINVFINSYKGSNIHKFVNRI